MLVITLCLSGFFQQNAWLASGYINFMLLIEPTFTYFMVKDKDTP